MFVALTHAYQARTVVSARVSTKPETRRMRHETNDGLDRALTRAEAQSDQF